MANTFSDILLDWHVTIDRDLPWKKTKDVFYIWLSEIILQQTRVEQGKPYFLKFQSRFRNVHELANASDEELMKLWEGLGYYSRARNLHAAAKAISSAGGKFPDTYEGLLEMKGVGPYTAAAIASFAYDLPVPVIDGNVYRVITRYFGITDAIDTSSGKKKVEELVREVFDADRPAAFNQAVMDFGALQCTPKNPECFDCPFSDSCIAYRNDEVTIIPYKAKKIKKQEVVMHYAVVEDNNRYYIRKRVGNGIWKHLHEFILAEPTDVLAKSALENELSFSAIEYVNSSGPHTHILTHRKLQVYFHVYTVTDSFVSKGSPYFLVDRENLQKFAFPKIIDWYLEDKMIS